MTPKVKPIVTLRFQATGCNPFNNHYSKWRAISVLKASLCGFTYRAIPKILLFSDLHPHLFFYPFNSKHMYYMIPVFSNCLFYRKTIILITCLCSDTPSLPLYTIMHEYQNPAIIMEVKLKMEVSNFSDIILKDFCLQII